MDKQELRGKIRAKRRAMPREEWLVKSEQVCRQIRALRAYEEAGIVYAYLAVRGEVLLDSLIEDAWRQGKRVAVPRVAGREMEFYRLTDFEAVELSPLGIREPVERAIWEPVEREVWEAGGEKTLFLMPGIAFDRAFNRVGQGGGYYDRYLAKYDMPFKLGVAFAFQVYPSVPAEEFDMKVDGIVTEAGAYGNGLIE